MFKIGLLKKLLITFDKPSFEGVSAKIQRMKKVTQTRPRVLSNISDAKQLVAAVIDNNNNKSKSVSRDQTVYKALVYKFKIPGNS